MYTTKSRANTKKLLAEGRSMSEASKEEIKHLPNKPYISVKDGRGKF
jgi:hypothetical protein